MKYVTPNQAKKHFGVTTETLREWARKDKIQWTKTQGGHYRYAIPQNDQPYAKYIYARVSSKKQKTDLERQIIYLKKKYPEHTVIKDIGSGINFKRKGLQTILEQVFHKNCKEVVVYSKDRLSRFANELLQFIFDQFGAKLIFVKNKQIQSDSEEFTDDLMAVVTVFTARYHGKRKYKDHTKNKDIS